MLWAIFNQISQFHHVISVEVCGIVLLVSSYTEYMVEIRKADKAGTILSQTEAKKPAQCILMLTEWTDFGKGMSPTSQEWQTLSIGCHADLSVSADISGTADLGSIRTRFERSIGNHVEDVPSFAPVYLANYEAAWTDDD